MSRRRHLAKLVIVSEYPNLDNNSQDTLGKETVNDDLIVSVNITKATPHDVFV